MKEAYEQFRQVDCDIAAVSFSPPEFVRLFINEYPLPFPLLSDPDRLGYKAFALDRTTWKDWLRPKVIVNYLRLILKGWRPWKSRKGDDLLQLGGDFILDSKRRLTYSYRSTEPTDRPSVQELLKVVRARS